MYPLIGYFLLRIQRIVPHLGFGQISTAAWAPRLHNAVEFAQIIIAPRRAVGLLRLTDLRTIWRDIDVLYDHVWLDGVALIFG